MISDCRTSEMKIGEWCEQAGVTKAKYYYYPRKVREVCLENMPSELVKVSNTTISNEIPTINNLGLDLVLNGFKIRVTESTPLALLSSVVRVIGHAQ